VRCIEQVALVGIEQTGNDDVHDSRGLCDEPCRASGRPSHRRSRSGAVRPGCSAGSCVTGDGLDCEPRWLGLSQLDKHRVGVRCGRTGRHDMGRSVRIGLARAGPPARRRAAERDPGIPATPPRHTETASACHSDANHPRHRRCDGDAGRWGEPGARLRHCRRGGAHPLSRENQRPERRRRHAGDARHRPGIGRRALFVRSRRDCLRLGGPLGHRID
jgi:hypothetical protein